MSKLMEVHARGAVFVCNHVAELGYPILRGKRDEPEFPEDTGWQFHCNRHDHKTRPLIWALEGIVAHEPTLDEFIDYGPGTDIVRSEENTPWIVTQC